MRLRVSNEIMAISRPMHALLVRASPRDCTRRGQGRRGYALSCLGVIGALFAAAAWSATTTADLAEAVRRGDADDVRTLLKADGAAHNLDSPGRDSMTPLLWASEANDSKIARLLLDAGADANLGNRYGITPLWLAATNRSAELVKLLLEHGADPKHALPHGETPLMAAARAGDAESIRLLVGAGADPNASETSLGETALIWAAGEDHAEAIRALVTGGADPNAHSRVLDVPEMKWQQVGMVSTRLPVGGWTALMYAARQDSKAAVGALIEGGANLDAQDPDGSTALELALINAHYDLAAQLLDAGANPNVADSTGMSALYAAVDMVTHGPLIGRPKLPQMDKLAAIDLVRLTLDHGADPNARLLRPIFGRHHDFGDFGLGAGATPLMRAAKGRDLESMRLLLKAGADPKATMDSGANTVFAFASAPPPRRAANDVDPSVDNDALGLLLEGGADINAAGPKGATPLHAAAGAGNEKVVSLLVEHGADLQAHDAEGRTPLDVVSNAGRTHNDSVAALLRQLAQQRHAESAQ